MTMSIPNDPIDLTREALRKLIRDEKKPNGIDPKQCGPWSDHVATLYDLHDEAGTAAVRKAWLGMVDKDPELAELYSGDTEPASWEWRTLKTAYEPKPPREYVVEGVLPLPSLSVFYGYPGGLKTMLLMDLALCVAAGKTWLDGLPGGDPVKAYQCQAAPVLWIDVDNGLDRLERRFQALGQAHGVDEDAPFLYTSFPSPPFDPQNPESVGYLVSMALEIGAKLVVFDNLGTVSGGADENSSQMIGVMAGLRHLAERAGASVIVIHHSNKMNPSSRAGNRLRGFSGIEAALDLALLIDREEGGDAVTIQSTKTRDKPVEPTSALWTWNQDNAGELESGRFFGLGYPEDANLSKPEKARQTILSLLDFQPGMNQSELIEGVKAEADVGRDSTLSALKALIRESRVRVEKGADNANLHYLN